MVLNAASGRALSREHATNAARRIGDIAGIARNEMDMDVHARLARGAADVHADVVSIRRMPRVVSGRSCGDGAPVPWQELVETGGWMIADPGKHVGEPSTRIDVIEPGGDHK